MTDTPKRKPGPRKRLPKMIPLSTYITEEQDYHLRTYAERHDMTIADVVRQAIEDKIAKEGK